MQGAHTRTTTKNLISSLQPMSNRTDDHKKMNDFKTRLVCSWSYSLDFGAAANTKGNLNLWDFMPAGLLGNMRLVVLLHRKY